MTQSHPSKPGCVVGYARVSTLDQADSGLGLAAQSAAIASECRRRGWQLLDVLIDEGLSGKNLRRPALTQALQLVETGQADTLMVSKLDRLSRSLVDFANLMERSQANGWTVVALDLGVELSTPAGEFLATLLAAAARWERRLISERTRDALAVRRSQGVRLGRPSSTPAPVLTRIVEQYQQGASLTEIATALNTDGVPTPRGGRQWTPRTIAAALGTQDAQPLLLVTT